MIAKAFDYIQQQHQLDDTNLSIRDLHLASESFFQTLHNMYHPRIPYPEIVITSPSPGELAPGSEADASPALEAKTEPIQPNAEEK